MPIDVPKSTFEAFQEEWLPLCENIRSGAFTPFTPLKHDRLLAARIAEAFTEGLAAMAPIPDSDRMWRGLDLRDHAATVWSQARRALAADPGDDIVRWTVIAFDLYFGDNGFAVTLIEPLIERGFAHLRWLVAGARWVFDLSGVDTSMALRDALLRLRRHIGGFDQKIEQLSASVDVHMREMAGTAIDVMRGRDLPSVNGSRSDPRAP